MDYVTTKKCHVFYFIPVMLSVILLVACSVPEPAQRLNIDIQAPLTHSSDWYLQKMQQSLNQNKADWQLLALSALLKEEKIAQATQLANTMPNNLTAIQQTEFNILTADLSLRYNDFDTADARLQQVDPKTLSPSQVLRFYQLVIEGHPEGVDLNLIRAYIALQPLLHGDAAQKNLNATWQALLKIPAQDASSLVINANEYTLAGWLDLLSCVAQNKANPDNLGAAFREWQIRYPDHPATKQIPTALQALLLTTDFSELHKVAVLLPLTGPGAVFSKAIQQGIEDAHNGSITTAQESVLNTDATAKNPIENRQQPSEISGVVPSTDKSQANIAPAQVKDMSSDSTQDSDRQAQSVAPIDDEATSKLNETNQSATGASNSELKFYDTNSQPVANLVQQAQQDGAQLIIGPLLKRDVEQVTKSHVPIKILALNQLENPPEGTNVCYFSLSPEDEARNAAAHIWAQNKRAPLLLIPDSELGQRVVFAFTQEWYHLGGDSVYQQNFGDLSELKAKIGSRDGMALKGKRVAINPSTDLSGEDPNPVDEDTTSVVSNPDAVYVVANQSELGLIKPMITMNIGAKNSIAFYASSLSDQGGAGTDFRFEMEGLEFSDIPLLAGEINSNSKNIIHQFDDDYNQVRLYAMGVDAWQLAQHFDELRKQDFSLNGQTGKLQADSHCVINRILSWSRYSQGKIVPVL